MRDAFDAHNVASTIRNPAMKQKNVRWCIQVTLRYIQITPIHVFDVSKQSERLTEGVVDLTVWMEFSANVPANTQAYALVINDEMLKFKRDGSKMSVLFQTR